MTVLFACDANAVFSPLAEAIARHISSLSGDSANEYWSAGRAPSHVRTEVRAVLAEEGISTQGLVAKGFPAVPVQEADVVVDFSPSSGRLPAPAHARRVTWQLPDPSSAPPSERMEAYRATRDEIMRRLRLLLREL